MRPTQTELLKLFTYYPSTGILYSAVDVRAGHAHTTKRGVRTVNIGAKSYQETHIIWCMMTGSWPTLEIDHKDMDCSNNRWSNLRQLNHRQNSCNRGTYSTNTSGVPGVGWYKKTGRWRARIMFNGELITLGWADNFEDAVKLRKEGEERYFKPFIEAPASGISP